MGDDVQRRYKEEYVPGTDTDGLKFGLSSWKPAFIYPIQETTNSTKTSNRRHMSTLPTWPEPPSIVYEQLLAYFTSHPYSRVPAWFQSLPPDWRAAAEHD